MTWDEWIETEGKDYPCPVCFAEFDTSEEKSKHLEVEHEYIKLETS